MTQMIKNLPATQENRVRSLGTEDLLDKGMATNASVLAWRIPWTENFNMVAGYYTHPSLYCNMRGAYNTLRTIFPYKIKIK